MILIIIIPSICGFESLPDFPKILVIISNL
jgi:hypothetical protein